MSLTQFTGIVLIFIPVAFNVLFFLLQKTFEYPDILRKPTAYILEKFNQGGSRLVLTWYCFALTGLLFLPMAILMRRVLAENTMPYMDIAVTAGILAGLVQFFGLIRWTFLVPYLAKTYFAPESSPVTRESIGIVFQAFHRFAGMAIGEHLGYLFTSIWTALTALALTQSGQFPAWPGWIGFVPAAGIFVGLFEEAGFQPAAAINAISYVLWSAWLIVVGVIFLFH